MRVWWKEGKLTLSYLTIISFSILAQAKIKLVFSTPGIPRKRLEFCYPQSFNQSTIHIFVSVGTTGINYCLQHGLNIFNGSCDDYVIPT